MSGSVTSSRLIHALSGFTAMLFMGCCYAWGIFVVPLEREFGWLRSETSFAFTLNVLMFSFGIIATGYFSRRLRYCVLMRLGAVMIGIGFLLSGMASQLWHLYFSYSLLCGFGIGMGYNCVISTVPRWFPEKPAAITGTLLVGYAVSTAIFGPVINMLISSAGISMAFTVLAVVCPAGLLAASLMLNVPSEEEQKLLPERARREGTSFRELTTRQVVRTPVFWLDFFMLAFISGSGMVMINHVSPMLQDQLSVAASTAALVITAIFIFNAAGRVSGGILLDRFGLAAALLTNAIVMLAAMACTLLGLKAASMALVVVGSALALFAFGSNANMIPCTVRELFGQTNFSMNYSIMNLHTIIVSAMPTIIGSIHLASGGYDLPLLLLVLLGIFDVLLALLVIRSARA